MSFTNSKVRSTTYNNKQHHRKVLLVSFPDLNGYTLEFYPQTPKLGPSVRHSKQDLWKVLLSGFHLSGHALGFHPQNQKLNHTVQYCRKVKLISFHLNGHTSESQPRTQKKKLEPPYIQHNKQHHGKVLTSSFYLNP